MNYGVKATRSAVARAFFLGPDSLASVKRTSLLVGTALGCSIAIMAASPNQAWAADECGADVGGVAICFAGGNPYPTGIDYVADAGEDITVILVGGGPGAAVDVVTATDDGVTATGVAGFDAAVSAYAGSSIDAFNDGIDVDASGGGAATVISYASISAGAQGIEAVALGAGGDVTVFNYGDILINGDTNAGYAFATGIYAQADDGLLVVNSGLIEASSTTDFSVFGIEVTSVAGYATVVNSNDIDVTNTFFYAYGISSTGADGTLVSQTGDINVYGADEVYGIRTLSLGGSASVVLDGNVSVESGEDEAIGVSAVSLGGVADINITGDIYSDVDDVSEANTGVYALSFGGPGLGLVDIDVVGDITISDGADATGIDVLATGAVAVDVEGDIQVGDFAGSADTGLATGIDVRSYTSSADVTVTGDIDVYGTRNASGVEAVAAGDATVTVTGAIYAYSTAYNGMGILAQSSGGDASVTLTGSVIAYGDDYADGILAFSSIGDASVMVTGNVSAEADNYGAHGLYLYAGDAANVDMTGDIDVQAYGTAYGILARAGSIEIDQAGDINVAADNGVTWGIYAYADGAVDIAMTGDIYTDVDNAFLNNTGILAASSTGSVDLSLTGDVTVSDGAFATAIDATGGAGVTIDVTGDIQVGDYAGSIYTFFAYGIDADASTGDIDVDLDGALTTFGYLDAIGVRLDSAVGDVAFTGSGSVSAYGTLDDATGLVLTASQAATASFTGDIGVYANDDGIGVLADGDSVDVTIDGDITVSGDGAWGVLATSGPGGVYVNVGDVTATSDYAAGYGLTSGAGIQADTYFDVTIIAGDILTYGDSVEGVDVWSYGAGINPAAAAVSVSVGSIETHGDLAEGMFLDANDDVDVTVTGFVTTYGDVAMGIYANSNNGYVDIDIVDVTTTGQFSSGVVVHAETGVNVAVTGAISTVGTSSTGVNAVTTNGDAYVSVVDVSTLGDFSDGADAASVNGDAYMTASGEIYTDGYLSRGLVAFSAYGDATIISSAGVETNGGRSIGLWAYAVNGDASASSTGAVSTEGQFAHAIYAGSSTGDAYVSSSDLVTTTGDTAFGVAAHTFGGDATVVSAGAVYTFGDYSHGLYAYASNGVATVDNADGHVETSGDYADGIYAYGYAGVNISNGENTVITSGYSAVGVFGFSGGDYVLINSETVNTSGDFSSGIVGISLGGSTADYVEVNSGLVTTLGDFATGIYAYAATGDVDVLAVNTLTHGENADGIVVLAESGDASVIVGNVIAYGDDSTAIVATTGGLNGANTDDVYVYVFGQVVSFDAEGLVVDSAGAGEIILQAGQIFGSEIGIRSASLNGTYIHSNGVIHAGGGYAIDVDGGAAFIQNNGDLYGFIDLTDNADHVENDGYWSAYGASSFGLGVDDVDNDGTLAFSRYTGAAATTTFTGLEFFDNAGLITGYDNQVNDVLSMVGTSFTGTGASEFEFDVQLGGPGSLADRLVIGSAQGSTLLTPNDILAGQPGALNIAGILVVDSANAAEVGNEFNMANIDKGFIEYSLFFDAPNDNWLIVALPDDEVFELLGAMSSASDFWRRSGDAVYARWQETRDAAGADGMNAGPGGSGRSDGWELWMQAHGGDESFDNRETFVIGGFTFAQDITASSDWRGFQFGFDNQQGDVLWGLTMGFNQQETTFEFDGNSFDTEGWNIGGYFGWAANGFFLNGLAKADFYEQDANFHTLPTTFTFDGVTWGVEGELGYRWTGDSLFLEPVATLAWTTTQLDSVTTSGATIDFDDAESLRGKAGVRVGGTWGTGDVVVTPYVGVYAVDEWQGDNNLTFTTGLTSITFSDQGRGSYGLADFGMTFQTFYGLEGFVKGEWNFGGDAEGGTARLGVRWRW